MKRKNKIGPEKKKDLAEMLMMYSCGGSFLATKPLTLTLYLSGSLSIFHTHTQAAHTNTDTHPLRLSLFLDASLCLPFSSMLIKH